jgi:drug/metabolite transporter (DMT)-like permease
MTAATPELQSGPRIWWLPSADGRRAAGTGLVLLSTFSIAMVPSFAKLAYAGGSNTLTVLTARGIFTVVLTWLVLVLCRQRLRIARTAILTSLLTGACYAVMLYGFLGAVAFIPVNTVILIYFIHPVLIGLFSACLGEQPLTASMLVALVTAFVGLSLAVGASFDHLNLTGVAHAFLATITCVLVIIGSGWATKSAGGLAVVFYMMLSATSTLAVLFACFGDLALPATSTGWLGFSGVAVGSTVGTLAFFCAIPMIGTVRATMISNVEPLLGILSAVILLGEKISPLQMSGIAAVLTSIVAMECSAHGRKRPPIKDRARDRFRSFLCATRRACRIAWRGR